MTEQQQSPGDPAEAYATECQRLTGAGRLNYPQHTAADFSDFLSAMSETTGVRPGPPTTSSNSSSGYLAAAGRAMLAEPDLEVDWL